MAGKQIQFYYKNVLADVIGPEHGITTQQLDELAKQTTPLIPKIKTKYSQATADMGFCPATRKSPKASRR